MAQKNYKNSINNSIKLFNYPLSQSPNSSVLSKLTNFHIKPYQSSKNVPSNVHSHFKDYRQQDNKHHFRTISRNIKPFNETYGQFIGEYHCRKRRKSQVVQFTGLSRHPIQTQKTSHLLSSFIKHRQKLRETGSTMCQSPKGNQLEQKGVNKVSQFKKIRKLGKGKFGDVYLVRHLNTGFICALKVIDKRNLLNGSSEQNQKAINQLIREIKIQIFLDHPNLIKLYDYFSDQNRIYLLLELAEDGHLYQYLQQNRTFSEQTTSIIVRQVLAGVNYMHKHHVIHRDLKLQNIVLCHGMAKICDFGWSVYCPTEFRSTLCGTPLYLSPQILMGLKYNKKIDSWAIGSMTHQLFTSQNPFKIKAKQDLSKIITQDFQMDKGSPDLKSFITFILKKDPSKRPDTQTIIKHPFIEKYKDLQTSDQLCHFSSMKNVK